MLATASGPAHLEKWRETETDHEEDLSGLDPKGQVVELHYFGGLSYDDVAEVLEISPATVHRDLRMARAWLYKELREEG